MSFSVGVSFARTPLGEISAKTVELRALGWQERDDARGDPWAASFMKQIPEGEAGAALDEVKRVMGDYWLDADEIRALLESARE